MIRLLREIERSQSRGGRRRLAKEKERPTKGKHTKEVGGKITAKRKRHERTLQVIQWNTGRKLLSGWEELKDDNGKPKYFNGVSKVTLWEKPMKFIVDRYKTEKKCGKRNNQNSTCHHPGEELSHDEIRALSEAYYSHSSDWIDATIGGKPFQVKRASLAAWIEGIKKERVKKESVKKDHNCSVIAYYLWMGEIDNITRRSATHSEKFDKVLAIEKEIIEIYGSNWKSDQLQLFELVSYMSKTSIAYKKLQDINCNTSIFWLDLWRGEITEHKNTYGPRAWERLLLALQRRIDDLKREEAAAKISKRRRRVMDRLLRYETHYSSGAEGYPPRADD